MRLDQYGTSGEEDGYHHRNGLSLKQTLPAGDIQVGIDVRLSDRNHTGQTAWTRLCYRHRNRHHFWIKPAYHYYPDNRSADWRLSFGEKLRIGKHQSLTAVCHIPVTAPRTGWATIKLDWAL